MKIAICFYGITRNFAQHTLESIQRQLFDVVAKHDPNFKRFAHINLLAELNNERTREFNVPIDPEEYKLLNCDVVTTTDQRLVDERIDFKYLSQFGNMWNDNFGTLKNVLRQFYSVNEVTQTMLQESAKTPFDLVIYSRICLRYEKPVEIPSRILPGTLYTPWFERYRGLNDRFALGDVPTMAAYGRRQSRAREFCAETGLPMGAENYLLWYARKEGLKTRHLRKMNFGRVRADGKEERIRDDVPERLKYFYKLALEKAGLRSY